MGARDIKDILSSSSPGFQVKKIGGQAGKLRDKSEGKQIQTGTGRTEPPLWEVYTVLDVNGISKAVYFQCRHLTEKKLYLC